MAKTSDAVEVNDPALLQLIQPDAPVEQLCTGFRFSEGPIWNPKEQCLYFSDMPSDIRRRWSPREGVLEVRNPSNKCNGMTYDADLNLIVCEHVTSALWRERSDGSREVLAYHWEGKYLNSPNDVCVHSSGAMGFPAWCAERCSAPGSSRLTKERISCATPRRRRCCAMACP